MRQFIEKNFKFLEVLFLFLLSLTPLLWLKDGQIILGHDSGFRINPIQYLVSLFYSWDPTSNFGQDSSLYKGFLITQAPEAFFTALTRSLTVGQELTFILWFFLMGCSMYIFINAFFSEKKFWIFRIFGSTFYMFNFFLLQAWFIVERAKFSVVTVLPLGVLFIYKTLTKEYSIVKGLILFSLTSFFFNGGGNPTFYASLILAYGITFIYLTLINVRLNGWKEIIYSLKFALVLLLGFLAVNSYFIFPQAYSFYKSYDSTLRLIGGISGILEWEGVISKNASLINLFRLEGIPDWGTSLHTYSSLFTKNPFLIAFSFVFPLILFYGLLNHNKLIDQKRNKLFFLALIFLVVGFPLTAGSHPPFGFLYIFFVKHLPGFAIFRSAFYKFGELLWFSYVFLVAFYFNFFLLKYVNKKRLYFLLGILSIVFILAYHFPFFKSNFFLWSKPFTTKVKPPAYVNEMSLHINQLPAETRILMLPAIDNNSADSYNWGFWSLDMLPRLFTNRSIISSPIDDSKNIRNPLSQSVSQNNERLFLQLTNLMGVNKILWRDDILFSDKKKKINSFFKEKENLENFKGVVLEKKSGSWSLYSISSQAPNNLFYTTEELIYFYSKSDFPFSFFSERLLQQNISLVLNKNSSPQELKGISGYYNSKIIQAECILCKPFELYEFEQKIKVPTVKFLPDSLFYSYVSSKEKKEKKLFENDPLLSIYANISSSNRRMAEILQIAVRDFNKENSEELMVKQMNAYKVLINEAINKANYLNQYKVNEVLIQLLSYLDVQHRSLSMINNKRRFAEEELEDLSYFIQDKAAILRSKIWMTSLKRDRFNYFVDLKTEGNYDLMIKNSTLPLKIEVDGKEVSKPGNNFFSSGMHRVALTYPFENLLINDLKKEDFTMEFDENAKFGIKNFQDKEEYPIAFEYKVAYGRPKFSVIEDGKIDQDKIIKMGGSNKWSRFSYIYKPEKSTRSPVLELAPFSYEMEGASVKLRNFTIIKSVTPSLFFFLNIPGQKRTNPKISFERIDPTKFIVNVENATEPFFLNFKESFNRGWKAQIIESRSGTFPRESFLDILFVKSIGNTVSEDNHFEINGYGNGWLIQRAGDYKIIVKYYPQRFFYLGLVISVITLFLLSGGLLYKIWKK